MKQIKRIVMEQNKKDLLIEQANKIADVLKVLTSEFDKEEFEDEINFLSVVKENLIAATK